ncbi:periplasmic binding protein-like I [Catenaria anguillulae PL171]|uniref:Periplasmic binding protein-like I n=1 Tax=Catenaria anguillulae PL171 TaxID=765915 RepID=A0A1Y2HMG3_9FUNG|nr:periplasmic binding protein-like I [Catenaria anguillulae PL171]
MAGDYTSRVTSPTALAVGSTFKMFMCSGTSTSSELSDKTDFPRFMRSIPDDPQNGRSLAAFVRNMGWSTVATIACTDSYGTSISTAFFSYVPDFNITIGMKQFFEPETRDVRFQLRAIKESGLRVIMLFGLAFEAQTVLPQALELGMVGPDYVWIGGEGMLDVFLRRVEPGLLPTLKKAAQGLMVSYPSVATNRLTTVLMDAWNSVYPNRLIVPYAMMYSECVLALARGLIRVCSLSFPACTSGHCHLTSHSAFIYFLHPFQGVTGDVSFAPNGDRQGEYLVYNFREGVYRPVYQILTNNTQIQIDTPQFFDGTPKIPSDRPKPAALFARWSDSSAQIAVALIALTSALILVCSAYIAKYRHSQTVKQLSFNFLMLISLGCLLWILAWVPQLDMPTLAGCMIQSWMYPTGISLILACSAAKAYRIWKIYDNAALGRKKRVTNGDLLIGVSAIMAIQWTLLTIGTVYAPPTPTIVGLAYPYARCVPSGTPLATTLVTVFQLGFLGILSLTVCFLGYQTRHVSKTFGESVWLFYAVQAVVLALCCLTPFQMLDFGEQRFAALWIHLFLSVYCVCFVYYALAGRVVVLIVLDKRHDTFSRTMEAFISATGATMNAGAVSSVMSVASAKGKVFTNSNVRRQIQPFSPN